MSSPVVLMTSSNAWRKLKATNFTSADFSTTIKSQKTRPTGDGVLDKWVPPDHQTGSGVHNWLLLRPFGTDASNETFDMRVWGWRAGIHDDGTICYENQLLAQLACVLGNIQGTAGCLIAAADFEVDTITVTHGASADIQVVSPANDIRGAWVAIDMRGILIPQIEFDLGTAAGANCLVTRG